MTKAKRVSGTTKAKKASVTGADPEPPQTREELLGGAYPLGEIGTHWGNFFKDTDEPHGKVSVTSDSSKSK